MVERLNSLLKKNFDAEKGFREAADDIENKQLQNFLIDKARQRYSFRHELASEIRNYGASPENESTAGGDVSRSWMNLKAALSFNEEKAILHETAKGENEAKEEYNKIIREDELAPSTLNLLIGQRNEIEHTLEQVKELERDLA